MRIHCADLGHYYRGNNVKEGARSVIASGSVRRLCYLPENRQPVATYGALLDDLMTSSIR